MTDRTDPTPAALYARVSSDRQDVDLCVAAQLRALREHAERNNYLVVRVGMTTPLGPTVMMSSGPLPSSNGLSNL